MKFRLSLILMMMLSLIGCGSPDPFQRGPEQKSESGSPPTEVKPNPPNGDKPQPGNPETPAPLPPSPPSTTPAAGLDANVFNEKVLPLLEKKCGLCHQNPAPNFERAQAQVVFQDLEKSDLYLDATGAGGRHRVIFKPNTPELLILSNWILGIQE